MERIEKARNEAFDKLRSIQTLEDVKKHDKEIVDTLIVFLTEAVEMLRDWSQEIRTLEPDQKRSEIVKMRRFNQQTGIYIEKEMDRMASIPGAEDHMGPLMGNFIEKMGPLGAEIEEINKRLVAEMEGTNTDPMQEASVPREGD